MLFAIWMHIIWFHLFYFSQNIARIISIPEPDIILVQMDVVPGKLSAYLSSHLYYYSVTPWLSPCPVGRSLDISVGQDFFVYGKKRKSARWTKKFPTFCMNKCWLYLLAYMMLRLLWNNRMLFKFCLLLIFAVTAWFNCLLFGLQTIPTQVPHCFNYALTNFNMWWH